MSAQPPGPPPHVQLIQMATGYWVSRILYVAAKLGLADHLAGGPETAEALAATTGSNPNALRRVMRTLTGLGVFSDEGDGRFGLGPLGHALRTGAPGAARASVLTLAGDWAWRGFEELPYSVETGKPAMERTLGANLFDWLARNPEQASLFGETMIGFHGEEPAAVAAAYDFSRFETIVDVGGGTGNLLSTIIATHPGPRGILFDLPHVVAESKPVFAAKGVSARITTEAGSFFEAVPRDGSAYLLSHVIHDWSEDQCLTILGHCRRAMGPDARLLIVEMVLPTGGEFHPGKLLDIMMLVGPGGQERTADEYRDLLARAGLRMTQVIPTASAVSIVEAVPT